ncbi:MAG: Cna B-type domain-containing protein, partial [Clostridia bacterium]|nr:Cna B-type domain-containing protein [Clostridia bacterium]
MNQDGWEIIKYEGQTVVFNIPETGNYEVKKFKVTVKDNNGNVVVNQLESSTKEKDGDVNHNKAVDKYILNHIVFNANKLTGTFTIDTAAGMFLVPNGKVKQSNGAGAGWIVAKEFTSTAEWHFYFHDRHYQAYAEKGVNISKTFTYQDGTALPSDVANKQFTFRMDEVSENTFQVINGNKSYHETVNGKAGNKIEFPSFGISSTDFRCKQNGEIDGDQRIYRYYVIQEVPDSDDTIITDSKKIYLKLEAHGHGKDKIDLKIWSCEDHQSWAHEVGEHGNVGTFNNYKKQYTEVEVEKKWQKAVYNGDQITYVDTTGEHTADSVEVKLIAVKSFYQQGAVPTSAPTTKPTSQPTGAPTATAKPTATPTPTATPKPTATPTPTPVPVYTLRFESSDDSLSVEYKYKGGTTVQFWFDNGNQWWHPYEGIRLTGDVNGTIGNNGNKFTITMNSNKTIKLTQTGNSNWGNVVTNSLHLSPAANGSAYTTDGIEAKQLRAFDIRYHIAANGVSDVSFKPASTIGSVQNGLKSVSEIIGNQDYTVVDTQTLSKANNWKYKWENLPKHLYDTDGSIYNLTYYIVETSAAGAASNSYSGNGSGKVIITNTEEETSVTVTKEWFDADNQDGVRPDSLSVDLMNGTTKVDTVTLTAANNWTATIDHLPKYDNGQLINYTWNETNLPSGYTFSGDAKNGTITTLTNTHTTDKVKVSVEKKWLDKGNQDDIRPGSVSVQLKADGVDLGDPVTLNAANNWHYEWTGLEKNKNGQPIAYSVDETTVPGGYTKNVTFTQDEAGNYSYTINNSHETEKVKVSVEKVWADKDNQDGKRASSVIVQLKKDNADFGEPVTLNESNGWKHDWTGLDKYSNGTLINYSVDETDVPAGYEKKVEFVQDGQGNYTYTVTNTHETEKIRVSVEKIWDDSENQDGLKPESVSVQLKAGGVNVGVAVTLNEGNGWSYEWTGLDKYKDGQPIEYTVDEVVVPAGYTQSITLSKDDAGNYGYTVKNSHETDKVDISVLKVWEDAGDQDGIRPDELAVQLKADGKDVGAPVTLNEGNGWKYQWNKLDKYKKGKLIEYTVDEVTVPEGYEKTVDFTKDGAGNFSYTLTNTHTTEETEVSVTKIWEDSNNQDGYRPAKVTVNLLADGTKIESVDLDASNNWSYSWTGLAKNANGTEIDYTVTEEAVANYTTKITKAEDGTFTYTVTNAHTTEKTQVDVTKVWKDSDNKDGCRPESVTVNLLANGTKIDSVELNAEDSWSYSWKNLAKKTGGKNIDYTVTEDAVTNYTTVITKAADGSFTYTVENTLKTTNVSGEKTWDMQGYDASLMPASITVYIKKGSVTVDTLTVKAGEDNKWIFTSRDLPKYEADGTTEITYTVDEEVPAGFRKVVTGNDITNIYIPKTTTVSGEKVWNLKGNSTELLPESITVYIKDGNDVVETLTVKAGDDGKWSFTSKELPKYRADGKTEIVYTADEEEVPGFEKVTEGTRITNTLETVKISGEKTWDMQGYDETLMPESITVYIKNGSDIVETLTVTAGEDNKWAFSSSELPKYEKGTKDAINYTVDEVVPADFRKVVTGNNITNTYIPKTTTVSGEKVWNLKGNSTELLPESITVYIKDGTTTVETLTVKAGTDGKWSFTSKVLPMYRKDGVTEINYTVDEEAVPGFEKVVSGTRITNTLDTVNVSGEKTWDMQGYDETLMPESITVYIKNGSETVDTLTVKAGKDNKWTFTSRDLPKYEKDGTTEITYTVDEEVPAGFSKVVTGNNIKNTYNPKTTTVSGEKVWNLKGNSNELLPEQITVYIKDGDKTVDTLTVKAGADGTWKFTSKELPKYRADGTTEIVYSVDEEAIPGFEKVTEGTRITNTLKTTDVTVEKIWDDNDNQSGIRPESVKVQLKANGSNLGEAVELNEENGWKYTWTNLVKLDNNTEIQYTVSEAQVTGYKAPVITKVSGNAWAYTITNSITDVKVSKVDIANGEELEGAHIQIIDKDGNVVEEWTSTKEVHEVKGLHTGETYTLKETVAPLGYTIATETTFVIDETGKVTTTGSITEGGVLLVEDALTEVKVSKVDIANGEELEGAHIQILDKDGNVVEEWTSTKDVHEVKGLHTGETYTLKETVAPLGYTIATETTFVIDETGKVTTTGSITEGGVILVEDSITKVKISKIDITNGDEELPGATLKILDAEGNEVETWVSGTEPYYVEGLKTGVQYKLV